MLNKQEKEKRKKLELKKDNLSLLITTSITILLGIFGIFISHYNSDKFIDRTRADYAVTTSIENFTSEPINKNTTDTINENSNSDTMNTTNFIVIKNLNPVLETTTSTVYEIDTPTMNISKSNDLNLPKIFINSNSTLLPLTDNSTTMCE